jgi:hypothetical protein
MRLLTLASIVALGFCAAVGCVRESSENPANPGSSSTSTPARPWETSHVETPRLTANKAIRAQVSEEELKRLESQALLGDPDSARIVFLYLSEKSAENTAEENATAAEVERWSQIAAENGDAMIASMLANRYMETPTAQNCQRAVFWYKRALSADPSFRPSIDDALNQLAEKWATCVDDRP